MHHIIVYLNKNDNSYYYRLVKHRNSLHRIHHINSYNHEVVLIIDNILENYYIYRPPLKKRLIKRIINFLEKKL